MYLCKSYCCCYYQISLFYSIKLLCCSCRNNTLLFLTFLKEIIFKRNNIYVVVVLVQPVFSVIKQFCSLVLVVILTIMKTSAYIFMGIFVKDDVCVLILIVSYIIQRNEHNNTIVLQFNILEYIGSLSVWVAFSIIL